MDNGFPMHSKEKSHLCISFRISLADGKRAGQKVQRKIAIAVQKVKPLYFLSRGGMHSQASYWF